MFIGGVIIARISDAERVKRLHEIDKLNQEELTDNEISEKLGVDIMVVKRGQKYLKNLQKADLTPEVLSEKRSELYLELSEATEEAKELYELYRHPTRCEYCKGIGKIKKTVKKKEIEAVCGTCNGHGWTHRPRDAERFLRAWVDIIEKKAKLYGFDNVKTGEVYQQFNFNREYVPDMKLPQETQYQVRSLAKKIKESHETDLRKKHEAEV